MLALETATSPRFDSILSSFRPPLLIAISDHVALPPRRDFKMTAAAVKTARYYPAEDEQVAKPVHKVRQNPPRVRKSITPGTVLIILAGRFRGKRVVCLKALDSGLLLVSGPYKINGVPLRRVNQAYVIATSTKCDVSKVDVASITDDYFSRAKDDTKEGESEFFSGDAPKAAVVSDQRKADQAKVDAVLEKVVKSTDMLEGYLAAHFSLTSSDKPHKMQF